MIGYFIAGYGLAFAGLILTCYGENFKKYHLAGKCICSLGFLLVAWFAKMLSSNDVLFWRLLPALCGCFLGDYFLARKDMQKKQKMLLFGIISFLLGHAGFLFAFQIFLPMDVVTVLLPLIGAFMTAGFLKLPQMETGKFKYPVLVYSYFVTALLVKCVQLAFYGDGSTFYRLILFGGLLFFVSDTIILFLYFYNKKYSVTRFFNLLTYYSATFLFAISILYV